MKVFSLPEVFETMHLVSEFPALLQRTFIAFLVNCKVFIVSPVLILGSTDEKYFRHILKGQRLEVWKGLENQISVISGS